MNPIIKEITAHQVKHNVAPFKVGDGVRVHTKVREGDKERVQIFAGVVIDALARFIPGVLGDENSLTTESFTSKLLDFPQYTRPAVYRGMSVPEVLLQGNHGEIDKWRHAQQLKKTQQVRPDLLK